ncbi:hypothetical protein LXL04_020844 [Taraxacum kok-saghyz]
MWWFSKVIEPSICELFFVSDGMEKRDFSVEPFIDTLEDFLSFTDNEKMRDSSTMVEDVVDTGFEDDYNEQVDEDSSNGDSDYIVDPEALVDDWDVDMREFHNAVDEIEWFGEHSHALHNISDDVDGLEVINSDVFESAGLEEDMRKRMLKNLNKKVACSSGEVHAKSFFVEIGEGTYKLLAIHSRRDLHIAKNCKIRVRVVCRGIISGTNGESDGGPSINSKVTCKGEKVNEKNESCPFVIQISRSNEVEPWLVKTVNDKHLCLKTRNVKACTSKFLADCPTTLVAPKHHIQAQKKRRMAADEPKNQTRKLSRKFLTVTSGKCHNKGHNSRTCKGQGGPRQRTVVGSSQGVGGSSQVGVGTSSQQGVAAARARQKIPFQRPRARG